MLNASSARESTDAARIAAVDGAAMVIAAGGDGTINATAAGLSGTSSALGILPLGSANDLARELGIPRDPVAAAAHIRNATPRQLDLVAVGERPFCTVGGVGLVATATTLVASLKRGSRPVRAAASALGGGIYKLVSSGVLLSPAARAVPLQLDYVTPEGEPRTITMHAHALLVTNHRTLGGGLVLPVAASAGDGVFELCVVQQRPRLALLRDFAFLSAGLPLRDDVLHVVRAVKATVRLESSQDFAADGELLATGATFELTMRPGALTALA